jgi:zinc/manganese transport system permease protein
MTVHDALIAPFTDYIFMRKALAGTCVLSVSACPVGVFLMLRRLSLTGDAMAHAILPGAALAFFLYGLAIVPMTLGGLAAGLIVALAAGVVSRATILTEDASLASFYLISLAAGVLLVSLKGSLDDQALILIAGVATVTLLGLAVFWRPLFAECVDPGFLRSVSSAGPVAHVVFLVLVVLNLVAGFQALGTLLAVGLMMLPAASARLWFRGLEAMCAGAIAIGIVSSIMGLLLSYHFSLASGPTIILVIGAIYVSSIILAPRGAFAGRFRRKHLTG